MFIKLTGQTTGHTLRINVNHITDYGLTDKGYSYVTLANHIDENFLTVTETAEQIDQLIQSTPTHPTVIGLSDLTD